MSHEEYRLSSGQPEHSPAQFTCFVPSVLFKERVWVVEHMDRVFECNSVLFHVLPRLDRIPFESNRHDTIITLIM